MKNPFHFHDWDVKLYFYPRVSRQVRTCETCGVTQSQVIDVHTKKARWIDGDIWSRLEPVFVLSEDEYVASAYIKNLVRAGVTQPITSLDNINRLDDHEDATILLIGRWWERTDIVETPLFSKLMNGNV